MGGQEDNQYEMSNLTFFDKSHSSYVLSRNMKNIRIFIWKLLVFGGEIFNIFEQACFRNDIIWLKDQHNSKLEEYTENYFSYFYMKTCIVGSH